MKAILKKSLSVLLRIIISIILLWFLFRQVDTKDILGIIKNVNLPILLVAFLINFFSYVLAVLRWKMLLNAIKINLQLKRVVISFAGGAFFNLFLPSTIGGDLVRSIDLAMHTSRPREVVATVLLDRLSGYAGLVIVALFALLFGWNFIHPQYRAGIGFSVGIITVVLIIGLLVLFNKFIYAKLNTFLKSPGAGRIRESITNLHQELHIFRGHTGVARNNLFFSLLIQIIQPLAHSLIAYSLGIKINMLYFFIFIPVITAITFLPISIGGLGLRDVSAVLFFTKAGVSKDLAFSMSLLASSFILIYGILGGLIYVFTIHHRRKQYHKPRPVHPHK